MNSICGVLAIHSKDASRPKEHARPGIGPPARETRYTRLVESITLELKSFVGEHDPELDLQHAAFMSYALHKVYEIVESITLEGNFVEFGKSTQKMRLDLRNTFFPELDLQHPRL